MEEPAPGAHPLPAPGRGGPEDAVVDAVLTASRSLIAMTTRSLGAAAEQTTIAQHRALIEEILCQLPVVEQRAVAAALRAFAGAADRLRYSRWPAGAHSGPLQRAGLGEHGRPSAVSG
jgi:hypothetical protein